MFVTDGRTDTMRENNEHLYSAVAWWINNLFVFVSFYEGHLVVAFLVVVVVVNVVVVVVGTVKFYL